MKDYGFDKSYVIDLYDCLFDMPLIDLYKFVNHELYKDRIGISNYSTRTLYNIYNYILFTYGENVILFFQRLIHSRYAKVRRIKSRVTRICNSNDGKFLTLTFTDDVLLETNSLTRRRYISRFLNSLNSVDFVANRDFGELFDREHYHAVISCPDFDFSLYKLGNCDCERIRHTGDDDIKMSKYLEKLSLHALKDSASGSRIIYKRTKN